jgi:glutamyl-tRNA(Gln) amidotransferase subunit D
MFAKEFSFFKDYDGLIIEGSGIGNAPVMSFDKESEEAELINKAIISLCKKLPVALTSQTIHGRVSMDVYSVSRRLKDAGVLGNNCDMTTETAYIKLAWLISNHPKQVKELYSQNLRGEITESSEQRAY